MVLIKPRHSNTNNPFIFHLCAPALSCFNVLKIISFEICEIKSNVSYEIDDVDEPDRNCQSLSKVDTRAKAILYHKIASKSQTRCSSTSIETVDSNKTIIFQNEMRELAT